MYYYISLNCYYKQTQAFYLIIEKRKFEEEIKHIRTHVFMYALRSFKNDALGSHVALCRTHWGKAYFRRVALVNNDRNKICKY